MRGYAALIGHPRTRHRGPGDVFIRATRVIRGFVMVMCRVVSFEQHHRRPLLRPARMWALRALLRFQVFEKEGVDFGRALDRERMACLGELDEPSTRDVLGNRLAKA